MTDVWSKDPRRKRGWLASTRGKVIGAAFVLVAAGAAGYLAWSPPSRVDCETMVGQSQAVLDQADKDLKAASATGTAARCSAYKKRVSALTELAKLPAVCGPPPKRAGCFPSANDERKWYETLIFEECRQHKFEFAPRALVTGHSRSKDGVAQPVIGPRVRADPLARLCAGDLDQVGTADLSEMAGLSPAMTINWKLRQRFNQISSRFRARALAIGWA